MSAPMLAFIALFSFKNGGGEANWPVTAYLSGLVLIVPWLASYLASSRLVLRRASWGFLGLACGLGLVLSVAIHDTRMLHPLLARVVGAPDEREPTPLRRLDPTCRLKGWQTLAREVDGMRAALRREGIEPVVAGGHWTLPG